jgi:catechol 2,3-dioxygenase-like lactoylglutathione lyase family enzyme
MARFGVIGEMAMFSHMTIGTPDLPRAEAFYDAVLALLGIERVTSKFPNWAAWHRPSETDDGTQLKPRVPDGAGDPANRRAEHVAGRARRRSGILGKAKTDLHGTLMRAHHPASCDLLDGSR